MVNMGIIFNGIKENDTFRWILLFENLMIQIEFIHPFHKYGEKSPRSWS